jgi:hypothetical protein
MRMKKTIVALASLLALAATAAWAQLALRAGKYDIKIELTVPGLPLGNSQQDTDCLSAADAKDLVSAMMRELSAQPGCTASNVKSIGNKLTFDASCSVQGTVVAANAELTLHGETAYDALINVNAGGIPTTLKIHGQWVEGACTE